MCVSNRPTKGIVVCFTECVKNMSLNDVYSQKYVPNPRSEALEYIDSVISEAEEDIRSELAPRHRNGNDHPILQGWKEVHAKVSSGEFSEDRAKEILSRGNLPPLDYDSEPSLDNLVLWRVQHVRLNFDYNLLSALRDALVK